MSPTTPIPKSNPASVISGATSTAARRQSTGAQPRQVEEPKRGGLGIVLFVLLAIGGGGAYVMRDDLMPMLLPDRQPTVIAPSPDTMAAPAPSPDAAAAPAESTRVATKDSSEQVIDTAIANLAVRLATALAIDMMAPPESVVVRVGSQTPETVLFINGQQVGPVGNRGLIPTTVAPGAVLVAIKKLNCRDWDTTLTALAGRRYTFVERSPRC